MHKHYVYRNAYRGAALECHGWLMGWGGVAYRASAFNDSLLSFEVRRMGETVVGRHVGLSGKIGCLIRMCQNKSSLASLLSTPL